MKDIAEAIFQAACEIGYPSLRFRRVPGRIDAEAKAGSENWRRVADWLARPDIDTRTFWVVIDAMDSEWRRLQEILECM